MLGKKKVTPKVMVLKSLKHHISKRNISAFDPLIRHFNQLKQSRGEKSIKDQHIHFSDNAKIMWLQDAIHFNLVGASLASSLQVLFW